MEQTKRTKRSAGEVRLRLLAAACALALGAPAAAETAVLEAVADATLLESAEGELANGSGPAFFVGRNNAPTNSVRRALVAFDVAGALPPGAWITGAALQLELNPSNLQAVIDVGLHRVLSSWSEGPSSASGGGGAPAEAGDATWLHTSYDSAFWAAPGGDFAPLASAVASVGEPGLYVWSSTPDLVADVQAWLDDPGSNHGWLLAGGEDQRQTAKSFASRESVEQAAPTLVVDYETSCDAFELGPGALGLCRAYCEALACGSPEPRGTAAACSALARSFARRSDAPLPCARPALD